MSPLGGREGEKSFPKEILLSFNIPKEILLSFNIPKEILLFF
jgi:hypothetical protein